MQVMPSDLTFNEIFLIVVLFILLLQLRQRKFHFWRSLILPGLMLIITIEFVNLEIQAPLFNMMVLVGGGILGIIVGMAIASQMKIKIAEDGSLLIRGSFIAISLWFVIIYAKFYWQDTLNQMGWDPNFLLSLFLLITVTSMISRRIYIYWRYLNKKKNLEQMVGR